MVTLIFYGFGFKPDFIISFDYNVKVSGNLLLPRKDTWQKQCLSSKFDITFGLLTCIILSTTLTHEFTIGNGVTQELQKKKKHLAIDN